ncbi:putative coiled-coil domain-containing protein mtmr15 [Diplodia seriata]|uniref:Fanconi-associated nuclease n=1 Tax=Diplodia seriata TaxID=420778 RepID=A0A0G2H4E1_9PEZI|nr:putative coiled-coil domain-containing protein mtmr15 [Diplodia seriata]
MVLQQRSPSKHNQMLGKKQTTLIPHPKSTHYDGDDGAPARPLKRVKRDEADGDTADHAQSPGSPKPAVRRVIPDSDAESDDEDADADAPAPAARTDLESALPPVETDKEAIEAYEIQRAAEEAERLGQDGRLREGKWVKGRSSIYVDAFNLALDTVLEEERHLFDEVEMEVFSQWRALEYEAQYLYAHPPRSSLTTIILAKIARRNYPDYVVSRSANIFASRALLLEFEASLRTQFRVDNILEFNGTPGPKDLQVILDLFEDVYPRWLVLIQEEQAKEDSIYISGEGAYLRRLSPAWVYTRIVHKATYVLGKFKQHKREHELLTELLTQRLFHASRRGAWYQRKALLEEHYMAGLMPSEGRSEESQKRHWRQIALQTCEEGLQDNLVHQIYHYDLQKRVAKLEKALKIAKRFQHSFSHVRLATPVEVTIEGIRIERESTPDKNRRNSSPFPTTARRGIRRTIWLDEHEGGGECSVEAMCLSHYRAQGWKGFHSEGGIVRTLFAHLFYDVLFAYVPNVFQTPFQTCPLDLHTDAFFPTRLSEINHRLARIANGDAPRLIRGVWDAHAERKTCVVGLDWAFEVGDLVEIAECFEGEALATVCRVVAQEYGQRGGGVPDLFLWHPERGEVMFAEVKSENDRLSDTQRLWIHVLTGAGVGVQLCNAVAKEVRTIG